LHTSQVTAASVGRAQYIPAGLIPPPVLEEIDELLNRLGYLPVDETWGHRRRAARTTYVSWL
jgi:hypothetical protein